MTIFFNLRHPDQNFPSPAKIRFNYTFHLTFDIWYLIYRIYDEEFYVESITTLKNIDQTCLRDDPLSDEFLNKGFSYDLKMAI